MFKVAASTRLTDADLRNKGLVSLGESDGWDYYVLPSDDNAATFVEALEKYTSSDVGKTVFDRIEDIHPYGAEDRRGPGVGPNDPASFPILVDIHLWPTSTVSETEQRLASVRSVLAEGEELAADTQPRFLLIRASVSELSLNSLLQHSSVERVRVPPVPYLAPTDWLDDSVDEIEQPSARSGTVGIIDDGVHIGHRLLDGIVDALEVPNDRIWAPLTQHGTMVAGLAAYGDFEQSLRDGDPLPSPVKVIAARVVEAQTGQGKASYPTNTPEHQILERAIREIVDRGANVINVSIADRTRYAGPHVDHRTEMLDHLARELDVVIVTAAGNVPVSELPDPESLHSEHPDHLLDPQCRVAEPSIAANCITVGSIARSGQAASPDGDSPPDRRAVAEPDQISPFSRTGPGFHPTGSVKPDVVHYGGNLVSQAIMSRRNLTDTNPGVATVSLSFPGPFQAGSGTSFSAPRVARIAAVIRDEYPNASANLTRALIGLSARTPQPHSSKSTATAIERTDQRNLIGFGVPDERRAIESIQNRVVMTCDEEMEVNTSVIHPIPIPEEFATGKSDRTIAVALAYDPPTRRFRREYLASRMRLDFYRAYDLAGVEELMKKQPQTSDKLGLPTDRRRVQDKLRPPSTAVRNSTLKVRRWHPSAATSLDPDDGDTYYLVVTHLSEPWAELAESDYRNQRYALAVELEDRTRQNINILERVRERSRLSVWP